MTLTIHLHDAAKRELDEATSMIAATHPRAAMRFLEVVRRDLEIIREYPLVGKKLPRSRLRQFVIDGWRHSIIYAVEDPVILVFAFAHHSRKPGYWRSRVPR
jgi:toxin ParE1/3/4